MHPDFALVCAIPYDRLLKRGSIVQAAVEHISADGRSLRLAGGQVVDKYDYLVVATGTSYAFPYKVPEVKRESVKAMYDKVATRVAKADGVVIVGGGSTGIEAAGEIAEKYPECKVTIVHAGRRLMLPGPWPDKYVDKLENQLRKLPNVEVICQDRVLPVEGQEPDKKYAMVNGAVKTQKGRDIKCDLMFWCVGGRINCSSYRDTLPVDNKSGCLIVDDCLRVVDRVFACGDCADAKTMKTVNFASQQATSVAENIKRHAKGKSLKPFKPGPDLNVTQIGHKLGAGFLPFFGGIVVGPGVVQSAKKDMFASKFWKALGYAKLPKDLENLLAADASAASQQSDAVAAKLERTLSLDPASAEQLALGLDPAELQAQDADHT